jgi:hypothetical protein
MRLALKLHPDSLSLAATHIDVDVARAHAGSLVLRYFVTGKIGGLRLPPLAPPVRTEELWQRTCFEAFVRCPGSDIYYEFNFAPSTQWAAYQFDGYRSGMREASGVIAPPIAVKASSALFTLQASLEFDWLSDLPRDVRWHLGVSALIEETSGRKSYWALAHPPGKPDFHHPDCFAHEFSAGSDP